jgi:ATP-dependent Zn protease
MGHALVALALPGVDVVHKVSIIPRGIGALGYTIQRPTEGTNGSSPQGNNPNRSASGGPMKDPISFNIGYATRLGERNCQ